jgi:hypothetical protein
MFEHVTILSDVLDNLTIKAMFDEYFVDFITPLDNVFVLDIKHIINWTGKQMCAVILYKKGPQSDELY